MVNNGMGYRFMPGLHTYRARKPAGTAAIDKKMIF
jgi:hypothetical protein